MEAKYELKSFGDERGQLIAIENLKEIPFETKRVFYMFGMDQKSVRGQHANRKSKFAFICLNGSCKICTFNGYTNEEYLLSKPNEILVIDNLIWKEMYDFSEDCRLIVLSDCLYDKNEYIYDKDEFIKEVVKNV